MRKHLIIGLTLLFLNGLSQDLETLIHEEMVTSYSESSDREPNEEEISLNQANTNKININRLKPADLLRIPFLSSLQAKNLAEYLNAYGQIFSIYELQALEGFDSATIQRIAPYLEIGTPLPKVRLTPRNLIVQGRHDLVLRYQQVMQQQSGYHVPDSIQLVNPNSYYLGSPQRYYFRYRYTFYDRVIIGISGDKDAGEQFFKGSQPTGMDFYSGFIAIRNLNWLKQAVIGNFRISFGQGLTLGGSSFGSSVSFGSSMQYLAGFTPSQSAAEYGYLRGVAVTIPTGPFEWSGFLSITRKDASIVIADTADRSSIRFNTFSESGYHRTLTELSKKNQIREQVYGGHASYRGEFFVIGLTGFYGNWDGTLKQSNDVYKRFMLEGSRFSGIGMDARFRIGFSQLFGEFSMSLNGGMAWLAGATAVPVSGVDLLIICRSYQPQFQNPFSTAISQNSINANEQGIYFRILTQLIPKTTISGYVDLFRFPWLRYRVNSPSHGTEAGVFAHYQSSPYWSLSLRYLFKSGALSTSYPEEKIAVQEEYRKNELKAACRTSPIPSLSLTGSFILRSSKTANEQSQKGYLASIEIGFQRRRLIKAIRIKYTLFDVPSYNARIYTYDPDLLYSFSAPAYYGRGIRFLVMTQVGLARKVDLWGYLGMLNYFDRKVIGNGLDAIEGNVKSEVKLQLRVRL